MPSRLSCTHTLSAPYTPKLSTCTLAISTLSTSSRTDRADGGVEELPCELGHYSGTPMLLVLTTVSPFWSVLSDYPEDDAVVLTPD